MLGICCTQWPVHCWCTTLSLTVQQLLSESRCLLRSTSCCSGWHPVRLLLCLSYTATRLPVAGPCLALRRHCTRHAPVLCCRYPHHTEVQAFLELFAEEFGVRNLVQFNTRVVEVRPLSGRALARLVSSCCNRWLVEVRPYHDEALCKAVVQLPGHFADGWWN